MNYQLPPVTRDELGELRTILAAAREEYGLEVPGFERELVRIHDAAIRHAAMADALQLVQLPGRNSLAIYNGADRVGTAYERNGANARQRSGYQLYMRGLSRRPEFTSMDKLKAFVTEHLAQRDLEPSSADPAADLL